MSNSVPLPSVRLKKGRGIVRRVSLFLKVMIGGSLASNLYRELFNAEVRIHQEDSGHVICRPFTFDATFKENFVHQGIEAFHIDGHTPGFTFYIFQDLLFICDYVFWSDQQMKYNPFGPADRTIAGGARLREILKDRQLSTVCGYNYVVGYHEWKRRFDEGPVFGGY